MKENLNYIQLITPTSGDERRGELYNAIFDESTFLPKTVLYKDIDEDFKRWVEEDLRIISDEGKLFPTMTLYSNQRFSEYSQTWKFTDKDNNLLLNFKSINRENNPQYGKIQNGFWNIPGDRFYTMKKMVVQDDNGTESFRVLKMKQPTAIDFVYTLTLFTSKYQKINEFNELINRKFASRQVYIRPNGHFMPVTLEGINDESEYNIDDRQYYAQSYNLKVMGYIITEDDYRVEEQPLKVKRPFFDIQTKIHKTASVEIEETECNTSTPYYNQPMNIIINFPSKCNNKVSFTIDTDFVVEEIIYDNVLKGNCRFKINDNVIEKGKNPERFNNGDRIHINISKLRYNKITTITIKGYDPNEMFDSNLDNPEMEQLRTQYGKEYEISAEE